MSDRVKRIRNLRGPLRTHVDSVLARADLALIRRSELEQWMGTSEASGPEAMLPPGAADELRADHPRLAELADRYRGHPATARSQWSEAFVRTHVDLRTFRADNAYVWQNRANTGLIHYALTVMYLMRQDPLGLLQALTEDGLFGALTYDIDGLAVSRDLLDSVTELTFLEEELGFSGLVEPTVLDIGAGYGRLAHRTTTALPGVTYVCTDAVPESTFLCEYYLRFRGAPGALAVPLDEIGSWLEGRRIDLAVNVHSFGECPFEAIEWWVQLLAANDVRHLMIVPNGEQLLSKERSGERRDFGALLESRGFQVVARRPKYAHSRTVQEHGVYPTWHYLLRRM